MAEEWKPWLKQVNLEELKKLQEQAAKSQVPKKVLGADWAQQAPTKTEAGKKDPHKRVEKDFDFTTG